MVIVHFFKIYYINIIFFITIEEREIFILFKICRSLKYILSGFIIEPNVYFISTKQKSINILLI